MTAPPTARRSGAIWSFGANDAGQLGLGHNLDAAGVPAGRHEDAQDAQHRHGGGTARHGGGTAPHGTARRWHRRGRPMLATRVNTDLIQQASGFPTPQRVAGPPCDLDPQELFLGPKK
jgi:hypothetical protein